MVDGVSVFSGEQFRKVWKHGDKWEYWSDTFQWWNDNLMNYTPVFSNSVVYRLKTDKKQNDVVNHPNHYYTTINNVEVDCLAAVEALGLQHHHYIASAFAYLWRCLSKGSTLTDLKKARFFIDREISQREKAGESK